MRYEYRTVEVDPSSNKIDEVINEYGRGGWRLVTVVPTYVVRWQAPEHGTHDDIHVNVARAIFERELE